MNNFIENWIKFKNLLLKPFRAVASFLKKSNVSSVECIWYSGISLGLQYLATLLFYIIYSLMAENASNKYGATLFIPFTGMLVTQLLVGYFFIKYNTHKHFLNEDDTKIPILLRSFITYIVTGEIIKFLVIILLYRCTGFIIFGRKPVHLGILAVFFNYMLYLFFGIANSFTNQANSFIAPFGSYGFGEAFVFWAFFFLWTVIYLGAMFFAYRRFWNKEKANYDEMHRHETSPYNSR